MTDTINSLPLEMAQATEALGQNLAASAPFQQYRATEQALTENDEAFRLLRQLAQRQGEIRRLQSQGSLTAADLDDLRQLQARVQKNQLITDYFKAQERATAYLQETNEEISNLLGINFAMLARVGGSC